MQLLDRDYLHGQPALSSVCITNSFCFKNFVSDKLDHQPSFNHLLVEERWSKPAGSEEAFHTASGKKTLSLGLS
jgi:hypothetical protein